MDCTLHAKVICARVNTLLTSAAYVTAYSS
jgi:hypothetical protein